MPPANNILIRVQPALTMAAALLLTPSLAFGGIRGHAARNILSLAASSSLPSHHSTRPSPAAVYHRSLAVRGGSSSQLSSTSYTDELSNFPVPTSFQDRREDVAVALMSVYAACTVTHHVQPCGNASIKTISKVDSSPVTVGDFASHRRWRCKCYIVTFRMICILPRRGVMHCRMMMDC